VDLHDRPSPKGHGEFEQWATTRWEKEHGSYSVVEFRAEFEYGVTDNFRLAIYLTHHYVYANGCAHVPWLPLGFTSNAENTTDGM
jgi:hypothetical protein